MSICTIRQPDPSTLSHTLPTYIPPRLFSRSLATLFLRVKAECTLGQRGGRATVALQLVGFRLISLVWTVEDLHWCTREGLLPERKMRGRRVEAHLAQHRDANHRNMAMNATGITIETDHGLIVWRWCGARE